MPIALKRLPQSLHFMTAAKQREQPSHHRTQDRIVIKPWRTIDIAAAPCAPKVGFAGASRAG